MKGSMMEWVNWNVLNMPTHCHTGVALSLGDLTFVVALELLDEDYGMYLAGLISLTQQPTARSTIVV